MEACKQKACFRISRILLRWPITRHVMPQSIYKRVISATKPNYCLCCLFSVADMSAPLHPLIQIGIHRLIKHLHQLPLHLRASITLAGHSAANAPTGADSIDVVAAPVTGANFRNTVGIGIARGIGIRRTVGAGIRVGALHITTGGADVAKAAVTAGGFLSRCAGGWHSCSRRCGGGWRGAWWCCGRCRGC